MIEFTTGVMFLMSSLYGAGHTEARMTAIASANGSIEEITTSEAGSLKSSVDTNSVEAYIRKEFADAPIMIEVARCESNFHQFDKDGNVIKGIQNNSDIGVMQINEKYHAETARKLNLDIYTTEGNVAYAKYLYDRDGSKPWVHSSKCWANKDLAKN